jgi:hypothetical protein
MTLNENFPQCHLKAYRGMVRKYYKVLLVLLFCSQFFLQALGLSFIGIESTDWQFNSLLQVVGFLCPLVMFVVLIIVLPGRMKWLSAPVLAVALISTFIGFGILVLSGPMLGSGDGPKEMARFQHGFSEIAMYRLNSGAIGDDVVHVQQELPILPGLRLYRRLVTRSVLGDVDIKDSGPNKLKFTYNPARSGGIKTETVDYW